eukprot:COSAG06_NODE_11668_length_1479_cov_1.309420_1_plen_205_part_00
MFCSSTVDSCASRLAISLCSTHASGACESDAGTGRAFTQKTKHLLCVNIFLRFVPSLSWQILICVPGLSWQMIAFQHTKENCVAKDLPLKWIYFKDDSFVAHLYESRLWVFDEAQSGFDAQDILHSRVQHFLAERAVWAAVAATLFHQALHRPFDVDVAATKGSFSVFPMFVPSLSWQIDHFHTKSRLLLISIFLTSPSGCRQR